MGQDIVYPAMWCRLFQLTKGNNVKGGFSFLKTAIFTFSIDAMAKVALTDFFSTYTF